MTDILERLQPGVLPIFRRTHAKLISFRSRREQITARVVALEILVDPLATLYTLHALNQRISERSNAEIATVEHALMMQGISAYLDAALRLPILENSLIAQDPRSLNTIDGLTRRAQHAAWQARDFAVLHSDIHAEEVQVAALLHYAPELLLCLRRPEQAKRLRRQRRKFPDAEAEIAVLGDTLDNLRLPLLELWNIPHLTLDLLNPKNAERTRQSMLAACLDIAQRSDRGWWDPQLMKDYLTLAGIENTPLETVIATVHANAARVARTGYWLKSSPAATWGPMMPGPWPPDEDEEEEEPIAEPIVAPIVTVARSDKATPDQALAPIQPKPEKNAAAEHPISAVPDKNVFRESLNDIEIHMDNTYTLNQMSAVILKGLHSGLGLSRVVLAMLTPDGLRVKARFTLGVTAADSLRLFEFELAKKDLFGQIIGKMQGVWVNQGNRAKLWPMVDPKLQTMLSECDFFIMSLFNGNKPIGIIYADRGKEKGENGCSLDPLTYTDFKMLSLQAARGLSKIKAYA